MPRPSTKPRRPAPPAGPRTAGMRSLLCGFAPLMLLASACALHGCRTTPEPRPDLPPPTMVRGDRNASAPRRASAARPRPFDEDHRSPTGTDRLALDELRHRRAAEHAEEHASQGLRMASFSHPACASLTAEQRRPCPLQLVAWDRAVPINGGVRLEVTLGQGALPNLRYQVLCHLAYGQAAGASPTCPFHLKGVRARLVRDGRLVTLHLLASDPEVVDQLRARTTALVP